MQARKQPASPAAGFQSLEVQVNLREFGSVETVSSRSLGLRAYRRLPVWRSPAGFAGYSGTALAPKGGKSMCQRSEPPLANSIPTAFFPRGMARGNRTGHS